MTGGKETKKMRGSRRAEGELEIGNQSFEILDSWCPSATAA